MSLNIRLHKEAYFIWKSNEMTTNKEFQDIYNGLKAAWYKIPVSDRKEIRENWDKIGY